MQARDPAGRAPFRAIERSVVRTPAFARRPRITNPVTGSVYAFDPDIPAGHQSLGVAVSGAADNLRLALDGKDFARAENSPQIPLQPGSHLLSLLDESGRTVDRVRFTVR
jgi:penicillin-binding protein 1C